MSGQENYLYEFGPFRLDPVKRRLLRDGEPVPLTPKAFDTLLALVQQSGRTVEKDDLMRGVWPGAVVEENNLNQNITALRKCLGDSRQESRYIATIPGLGYRFVAGAKTSAFADAGRAEDSGGRPSLSVEKDVGPDENGRVVGTGRATDGAEGFASHEAAERRGLSDEVESLTPRTQDEPEAAPSTKSRSIVAPLALALLFVAATAYAFWAYRNAGKPRPAGAAASEVEVTALTRTGTTMRAVISPDGRY